MSEEQPIEAQAPKKSKKKEITFARPVFSAELLSDEAKDKFDQLPAWQRHFIKRMIDHGDLSRAAQESGVSTHVRKHVDEKLANQTSMTEALEKGGLTPDFMVSHLMECLNAEHVVFDKHRNPIRTVDLGLKLKVIEMVCKLRGDFKVASEPRDHKSGVEELFQETEV